LAGLCLFLGAASPCRADGQVPADQALPPGALLRLGSKDLRHPGARSAVYSQDGTILVTGGSDIRFWDARTRRLVRSIPLDPEKDRGIWMLRISGNGKTLCGMTHTAAIVGYDFASGRQLFRIKPDDVYFSVFDLSHDGKVLATGTCTNEMILWETATQKKLRTMEGDLSRLKAMQAAGNASLGIQQPIGVIAHSPDGNWLAAVALYDLTVRVYDMDSGKQKHAFPTNNPSYCGHVRFSPDSAYLAASRFTGPGDHQGSEVITVWDLATGKVHQQFAEPAFFGFAVSPDWKWMAADGAKGELHVWERATGQRRVSIPRNVNVGLLSLAFSKDGDTLVGCGHSLNMWDLKTGRDVLADEGHTGTIRAFDLSADSSTVASGGDDGTVFLWDARTGKVKHHFTNPRRLVTSVAFSPDGRTLATSYYDLTGVVLRDVATGKELHRIAAAGSLEGSQYPLRVAFSPDGKMLAVGTYGNFTYHFFDVATWKEQRRIPGFYPFRLSTVHLPFRFSPDGKHFAGLHAQKGVEEVVSVALWDLTQQGPLVVGPESKHIEDLAFSPDGEYLAWSDLKDTLLWDVREKRLMKTLPNVTGCVAFTPDGRYLAAGKRLHPLDPKHPPLELPIQPGHLAFSRDGRLVVAVPQDECTILVLDATKLGKRGRCEVVAVERKGHSSSLRS
jgi:WD40 repeat protein